MQITPPANVGALSNSAITADLICKGKAFLHELFMFANTSVYWNVFVLKTSVVSAAELFQPPANKIYFSACQFTWEQAMSNFGPVSNLAHGLVFQAFVVVSRRYALALKSLVSAENPPMTTSSFTFIGEAQAPVKVIGIDGPLDLRQLPLNNLHRNA